MMFLYDTYDCMYLVSGGNYRVIKVWWGQSFRRSIRNDEEVWSIVFVLVHTYHELLALYGSCKMTVCLHTQYNSTTYEKVSLSNSR